MTPAVRPHGYLEGVPTVNDRTRPPLDVEPVLRLTGEQIGSITPPPDGDWFVDWDEYEEFVPKRLLDAAIAAAYQPTGPDDLAGLRALSDAATPGPWYFEPGDGLIRNRIGSEGHRRGVGDFAFASLHERVYPDESDQAPAAADGAFIVALVNWFRGVTLTGVRSSEVDGLREALDTIFRAFDKSSNVPMFLAATIRDVLALTGDTGPKVEPEHREQLARAGHLGAAHQWATPEPSNDD